METKQTFKKALMLLVAALLVPCIAPSAFAQDSIRNNYIPTTISPEAQKVLAAIYASKAYERKVPAVDDMEGWRTEHAAFELAAKETNDKAVEVSKVTVADAKLGGVPVLDIRPNDWKDNRKVLVYTHGGAYTMFPES